MVPEPHHLVHDALKAREYQAWSLTQYYYSDILPFKDQWEEAKGFFVHDQGLRHFPPRLGHTPDIVLVFL